MILQPKKGHSNVQNFYECTYLNFAQSNGNLLLGE
jgi:hypothetical protein